MIVDETFEPRLTGFYKLVDQGRFAEADGLIRSFQARNPADANVAVELCWLLARQERWTEAKTASKNALAADPSSTKAAFVLGQCLARSGDYLNADAALRRSLIDPANKYASFVELGRLRLMQDDMDSANDLFSKAINASCGEWEALVERLAVNLYLGRWDEAVCDAEAALDLGRNIDGKFSCLTYPFGEMRQPPWTTDRLRTIQRNAFQAFRRAPNVPWAAFYCLMVSLVLGDTDFGETWLQPLLRVSHGRYRWMRWLAGVHFLRRERWRRAADLFEECLLSTPGFMRCAFLLADALIGLGAAKQALEVFERLRPVDHSQVMQWLETNGEINLRLGRYQRAGVWLGMAARRGSSSGLVVCWRGAVSFRSGGIGDSVRLLTEAMRRLPADVEPPNWRGWAHRLLGDQRKAMEDLRQVRKIFPEDLCARLNESLIKLARPGSAKWRPAAMKIERRFWRLWPRSMKKGWGSPLDARSSPAAYRVRFEQYLDVFGDWLAAHDIISEALATRFLTVRLNRKPFDIRVEIKENCS